MMNTLGGSGTHAVMGMRIWHGGPFGLIAYIGDDLPVSMRRDLERLAIDPSGVISRSGIPTPRAWQLYEQDGFRNEVFRTSRDEMRDQRVQIEEFPQAMRTAKGYHIQSAHNIHETIRLVRKLREYNPATCIVYEPVDAFLRLPQADWSPLLRLCDVFLPNWAEAHCLTGRKSSLEMAQILQEWGARNVVIRMGDKGVRVLAEDAGTWCVPAIPVSVVDVTGAGNSFCGGMLTGMGERLGLLAASLRGVVSASFTIEQFGVPTSFAEVDHKALNRYNWARENMQIA